MRVHTYHPPVPVESRDRVGDAFEDYVNLILCLPAICLDPVVPGVCGRPSRKRLGHGVHAGDAGVNIGRDNCITNARERGPKPLALFEQSSFGDVIGCDFPRQLQPLRFGLPQGVLQRLRHGGAPQPGTCQREERTRCSARAHCTATRVDDGNGDGRERPNVRRQLHVDSGCSDVSIASVCTDGALKQPPSSSAEMNFYGSVERLKPPDTLENFLPGLRRRNAVAQTSCLATGLCTAVRAAEASGAEHTSLFPSQTSLAGHGRSRVIGHPTTTA